MRLQPVLLVIGVLLATLGIGMMVPAVYDLNVHNPDWLVFATSGAATLFIGALLAIANRGPAVELTVRQAFLLTAAAWAVVCAFGAVPFTLSSLDASFADAYFETMSGLTTTGATVFAGLDKMPPGILLWRSILCGLGGVGIIVMAMAVLPMLSIGGMQLFRTESSDKSEKILPRATQIAGGITLAYLALIVLCAVCYYLAGMSPFDAVNHAMPTLATGGFSTHDASIGHFDNWRIELVAIVFMILGSLPFVLYVQMINGRHLALLADSQVRWFLLAVAFFTFLAWQSQATGGQEPGLLELRDAAFSVVSVLSTTGFVTVDYNKWGAFAQTVFFIALFVGGCTGSTAGAIKIFRFQVLFEVLKARARSLLHPSGIFIPKYQGKPVEESTISSMMSFLFLYMLCFFVIAAILGLYGLDTLTSLSASATALGNVGPGLGDIVGPAGNFSSLPDGAKWALSAGMLLGRLELFTVLVIFTPQFWRY
jgi:trk system potassium uptake protein TrkH